MIEAALNGVVVGDPTLRTSKSGNPWMSIGVMVGNGDNKQYVQLAIFGDMAVKLSKTLKKGSKIYAEGNIRINEYEKDGVKKSSLNMSVSSADQTHMVGKRNPARQSGCDSKLSDATRAAGSNHERPIKEFDDALPEWGGR